MEKTHCNLRSSPAESEGGRGPRTLGCGLHSISEREAEGPRPSAAAYVHVKEIE